VHSISNKSPATVLATFSLRCSVKEGEEMKHRERKKGDGNGGGGRRPSRPSAAELPVSLSLMRLVPALHRSSCSAMLFAAFLTQPCSQLLLFLAVAAFGTGLASGSWLRKIKKHYQPLPSPIAAPPSAVAGWTWTPPPPPASRSHLRHQFRNGRPGWGLELEERTPQKTTRRGVFLPDTPRFR
jgi:hypothetical protein